MNGFFREISAVCDRAGAQIMSVPFLNPQNVAKEVGHVAATIGSVFSSVPFPNAALLAVEVTQVFVMVSAKFDDVITYPKASMLGNVVNFFAGDCTPVVIAARAILVAEATLAISKYASQIRQTAIKMADYLEGKKYPLAISWLRQKESYSPSTNKTMRVVFICQAPPKLAKKYLETERFAKGIKRITWKSLLLAGTICKIGACLFITPISKNLIVSSMFSNLVKIYENLKKIPREELIKGIEANASHVQVALACIGCKMDVAKLMTSLNDKVVAISDQESTINTLVGTVQRGVQTLFSLTTGLQLTPIGLPPEIHNDNTSTTRPPRKAPRTRYFSET